MKKTHDSKMSDIDVESGGLPKYDVETMDVEIKAQTKEVEVLVLDVEMPENDEDDIDN